MGDRSRGTDRRYYGVAEAVVVENEDREQGEGRVRLKLPWFSDDEVTDWCRVVQFYAGDGYGSLFVPEVGDEVIVAFVHGDLRLPIVLGGAYNGVDKPPTTRSATVDQKVIRTKAGHQIVFDDKGKKVTIESAGGNRVELDDNNGSITISATTKLVLEATNIEINGSASVAVSGGEVRLN